MFTIPFVEVKVTKGLRRISGRRRSRSSTTLAFPLAVTLWSAGWENGGSRLTLRCWRTWLSGLTILWCGCWSRRLWCRGSWLTKIGVVCGKLVSGCNVSILTYTCNVSLHDLQQLFVGLLLIIIPRPSKRSIFWMSFFAIQKMDVSDPFFVSHFQVQKPHGRDTNGCARS